MSKGARHEMIPGKVLKERVKLGLAGEGKGLFMIGAFR
jgi:hypothetical protein